MRAAFAVLLWLVAAWPVTLIAIAASSPVRAVRLENAILGTLGFAVTVAGGLAALALLLWPPFWPSVRLGLQKLKLRLSINRLPTLEALDRLRSFENPADHLVAGRGLLAQGLARQAVPHLSRAMQMDPTDLRARFSLAQAAQQLGAHADAEALLAGLVEQDPEHGFGDAMLHLARIRLRLGAAEPAAQGLERFLARFGKKREALFLLAKARLDLGDRARATAVFRDATRPLAPEERRDPNNAYWRARSRVLSWTSRGVS